MQHQKAIVKKKVPEGKVLAEAAGSPQRGQHPRPLRLCCAGVIPLRRTPCASSPFRGAFCCATDSVPALSVTCGDSSPKGGALGKTKSFAVLPKPLPLTDFPRSGEDGEARKGNKVARRKP